MNHSKYRNNKVELMGISDVIVLYNIINSVYLCRHVKKAVQ